MPYLSCCNTMFILLARLSGGRRVWRLPGGRNVMLRFCL
jgi:hypothetical protein